MSTAIDDGPLELEPTGNRLVSVLAQNTESGLVLPLDRRPTTRLRVAARGPAVSDLIQVGADVIVKPGAAIEISVGEGVFLVFAESDVLAIVRPTPKPA